ncbi:MAG: exosortase C-terminal domain/associated protein EpsI [Myxococcota bacterium]
MTLKLVVAGLFLAANFYTYHYLARAAVIPPRATFDEFPLELADWSCPGRGDVSPAVWKTLGATDILLCDYYRSEPAAPVSLYVGYHASQIREEGGGGGENSIHPPAHCLPGSGWAIIDNRTVPLELAGLPGEHPRVKRLVIAKGQERQLVYYWYQSRGRVISEDWQKILYVGFDRATRGRTDGSLVRFTVPIVRGDEAAADDAFLDLAPLVVERLDAFVPI